MRLVSTLIFVSLAAVGCKKDNKDTGATTGSATGSATSGSAMAGSDQGSAMAGSAQGSAMAGSAAGAGAGSDMAGSGAGSAADAAAMAHHAGNCPSTVLNSASAVEWKMGWKYVIVHVTSTDKDAIAAIQKRTDEMLKARLDKKAPGEAHDQRGTHGGKIGLCPLHIPEGGTATAKHEKDGVSVTITPKDNVEDLKKEIDARIAKAADWVKNNIKPGDQGNTGGVGGGKGKDGSNHSGQGDGKGQERKKGGGSGGGTGGGGGKGTGGGTGGGKGSGK